MLNVDILVVRGITFIRLEGCLTKKTFNDFNLELDNLLYNFGMHFYVFNFSDVFSMDRDILEKLENKLYEIFLSCGDVALCGIKKAFKDQRLIYINSEEEFFSYLHV